VKLFYQLLWMDLLGFHLNSIYTLDTDRTQDIHDVVGFFLGVATCQPDLIENPAIAQLFQKAATENALSRAGLSDNAYQTVASFDRG